MALADLTAQSVVAALKEHDQLGRVPFLTKYGFKEARHYFVLHEGKQYDSKALAGAAHGFLPGRLPLPASEFSGGERTVKAKLESPLMFGKIFWTTRHTYRVHGFTP
jgi:5-methylcytosine-specific restriction enzyme A